MDLNEFSLIFPKYSLLAKNKSKTANIVGKKLRIPSLGYKKKTVNSQNREYQTREKRGPPAHKVSRNGTILEHNPSMQIKDINALKNKTNGNQMNLWITFGLVMLMFDLVMSTFFSYILCVFETRQFQNLLFVIFNVFFKPITCQQVFDTQFKFSINHTLIICYSIFLW